MARGSKKHDRSTTPVDVWMVDGEGRQAMPDHLATEEPLEIRLAAGGETKTVAVTMRTPGADEELTLGFLHNEGVVSRREEILRVDPPTTLSGSPRENVALVELADGFIPDLAPLERHFFTTSACGDASKGAKPSSHFA